MTPTRWMSLALLSIAAWPPAGLAAQPAANVPPEALRKLGDYFRPTTQPASRQQAYAAFAGQMDEMLADGERIEKAYPQAANLHEARMRMLEGAHFLSQYRGSEEAYRTLLAIARRIVESPAPDEAKLTADYFLVLDRIRPRGGAVAADASDRIRRYVARYAKGDHETKAVLRGAQMAGETGQAALEKELLDRLEQGDRARDAAVHAYLRKQGRRPPFFAELTAVDGRKIVLPDAFRGQVVVVDFWATSCGPWLAALPHMKELYAAWHGRGAEFLGISLDGPGKADELRQFVRQHEIAWPQTYSGKGTADPTARQYGIAAIPAVWLLDRQGRVVTDDACGQAVDPKQRAAALEAALRKALAEPAAPPR